MSWNIIDTVISIYDEVGIFHSSIFLRSFWNKLCSPGPEHLGRNGEFPSKEIFLLFTHALLISRKTRKKSSKKIPQFLSEVRHDLETDSKDWLLPPLGQRIKILYLRIKKIYN